MSTLEKLRSLLVEQFGIRSAEIDPDSPLQAVGMEAADLERLRILIEEDFNLNMSVIEEEHRETDIETRNLRELTLRQLAGWLDDWLLDVSRPRFRGRLTKPS